MYVPKTGNTPIYQILKSLTLTLTLNRTLTLTLNLNLTLTLPLTPKLPIFNDFLPISAKPTHD